MKLELRKIERSAPEISELQHVLEAAPDYSLRCTGLPPSPSDAQSTVSILPPGWGYEDKFVYGIYLKEKMIGCVDLIRFYPNKKTAMLGLLLLTEPFQKKGYGEKAYEAVETIVREWSGVETLRIAVLRTNDIVIPFWERLGFVDTGARRPYHYDKIRSEHLILEKKL